MGHILQHSRVLSNVFYQFCSFVLFLIFLFLFSGFICVYVCVLNCIVVFCHYGEIKHNKNYAGGK